MTEDHYITQGGKRYATGCYVTEDGMSKRFRVYEGSICVARTEYKDLHGLHRQELVNQGVIVSRPGDEYIFLKDHVFDAPSSASAVVLGRSSTGYLDWRTADGTHLKNRSLQIARKIHKKSPRLKKRKKIRWLSPVMRINPEEEAAHQRGIQERDLASMHHIPLGSSENTKMSRKLSQAYADVSLFLKLLPEDAAANIRPERLVEFSLEVPQWLLKFAEAIEARRLTETPDAAPRDTAASLAVLKAELGIAPRPVEVQPARPLLTAGLRDREQKLLDWLREQPGPQTTTQAARGTGMSKTTVKDAKTALVALGLIRESSQERIPVFSVEDEANKLGA